MRASRSHASDFLPSPAFGAWGHLCELPQVFPDSCAAPAAPQGYCAVHAAHMSASALSFSRNDARGGGCRCQAVQTASRGAWSSFVATRPTLQAQGPLPLTASERLDLLGEDADLGLMSRLFYPDPHFCRGLSFSWPKGLPRGPEVALPPSGTSGRSPVSPEFVAWDAPLDGSKVLQRKEDIHTCVSCVQSSVFLHINEGITTTAMCFCFKLAFVG